jgi:2,3-diketo-5-methylthiopentyl-1-phosphate enolase
MYCSEAYQFMEGIEIEDHIIATYYIEAKCPVESVKFIEAIAGEQSTGTWLSCPFETKDLRAKHTAKIIGLYEVPAYDRELPDDLKSRKFTVRIAYPTVNIGSNLPMIFTTAIGNISAGRIKLVDLEFPYSFTKDFKGPKFGIEGIRDLLNIRDRPLLCNMIKPDVGWSPSEGAIMAHDAFIGGVDIVKDDELLVASPEFCPLEQRVKSIMNALKSAEEETGEKKLYTPNITDDVSRLKDHAKRAIEAGANALMINIFVVGFSAFRMIAEDEEINVPILAHPDYAAATFSSENTGVASYLMQGKMPRLSGADIMIYTNSYGKIPIMHDRYIQTAICLRNKFHNIKSTFPAPGGGVYPGIIPNTIDDLGIDTIVAAGGAVHGHPDGSIAGAKALRQAIQASVEGVSLEKYAEDKKELAKAIEVWGLHDKDLFDMKR